MYVGRGLNKRGAEPWAGHGQTGILDGAWPTVLRTELLERLTDHVAACKRELDRALRERTCVPDGQRDGHLSSVLTLG
jgi:hypothetical protein